MIDRLESSGVAIARDVAPQQQPPPPVALEYQPPQPAGRGGFNMGWGLLISFFLAMGVGWFIFGALMMFGYRDDHAGPMAIGAGFFTLGVVIGAALVWSRRQQPPQSRR